MKCEGKKSEGLWCTISGPVLYIKATEPSGRKQLNHKTLVMRNCGAAH